MKNLRSILNTTTQFQTRAQKIPRYDGNPYVQGDNLAEHIARCVRLAGYLMPHLTREFESLIYANIIFHDDDEIVDGFDILTSIKDHNSKDPEEFIKLESSVKNLGKESSDYVMKNFRQFREKKELASKLAKVIDNIAGNQLVYEQKLGLVAPDQAKFAIWHMNNKKVYGVSKKTDKLIDEFTEMIYEYRELTKSDEKEISRLAKLAKEDKDCNVSETQLRKIIKKLLDIDLRLYEIVWDDINKPIWEY